MTSIPSPCPHEDVHYNINLVAFGDTNIRYVELQGHCKLCKAEMKFQGDRYGMNPRAPALSLLGETLYLPVMFGKEVYDQKAVGYAITVKGLDEGLPS